MSLHTSARAFGIPIWLGRKAEFLREVDEAFDGTTTQSLHTLNPEILMAAHRDAAYQHTLLAGRWNVVDGVGLQKALERAGAVVPERLCGSDIIEDLAALCARRGRALYFVGGAPERLAKACEALRTRHPGLVVTGVSPKQGQGIDFAEMDLVREDLAKLRPAVVAVCLGAPRQEQWIEHFRDELSAAGVAVAGGFGGTVDFLSGDVARAPVWVRRIGMEWAFRLLSSPSRLRRQLRSLPAFAIHALQGRQFSAGEGSR